MKTMKRLTCAIVCALLAGCATRPVVDEAHVVVDRPTPAAEAKTPPPDQPAPTLRMTETATGEWNLLVYDWEREVWETQPVRGKVVIEWDYRVSRGDNWVWEPWWDWEASADLRNWEPVEPKLWHVRDLETGEVRSATVTFELDQPVRFFRIRECEKEE